MLGLKIFLGVMIALMLLGIIGARTKCSKSIAGAITICCIVLLAAIIAKENQQKVTAVAPESGKIQTEQNAWGTITVTDDTGVTREYQGCIHISGTYPYETTEYIPCIGVYNRPSDYPDKCVARLFDGTKPTNIIIIRNTVEEIREDITKRFPAMLPFARDKEDCKCVVETWI